MRKAIYLLVGLSPIVSGCVSSSKPLQNAQGQVMECRAEGWGWLGAPLAKSMQNDCVERLKSQGFVELGQSNNEPALPNSAVHYTSSVRLPLPDGWQQQAVTPDLKAKAVRVYAQNMTLDAGVMLSTIKRSAITDMQRYVETRRASSMSIGADPVIGQIWQNKINGHDAYHHEVSKTVNGIRLRYLDSVLVGTSEIAYVSTWVNDTNYARVKSDLETLAYRITGLD